MGVWSLWPINYSGLLSPHCDVMMMCGTMPGIWLWLYGYHIRLWVGLSKQIHSDSGPKAAGRNQSTVTKYTIHLAYLVMVMLPL